MIKTWSGASVVFPQMVGHTIAVHDGCRTAPWTSQRIWLGIGWAVRSNTYFRGHIVKERRAAAPA